MVAAFGNLEIAVMARREFQTTFGDQIDERIGDGGRCFMHRIHHILILMRAGDCQHAGEACTDQFGFIAHAAGDDDAAVFGDCLTDRFERFLLRGVEKAAGVDQHDVGPRIIEGHLIAIGAQFRQDAFAVDERLGAAKRNHADLGRGGECRCHDAAHIGCCACNVTGQRYEASYA